MVILGLGGILSDAACAVLSEGRLAAAAEQKKIARRHDPGELPDEALKECLEIARVEPSQVDCVAVARPFAEGPETTLHLALRARFPNSRFVLVEHHAAHAASAYYPSGFDDATVLTLDRRGDFRCGTRWRARGNEMQLDNEMYEPDSIADMYSRVTELLGLQPGAEEHKVQWMSTSGDDRFVAAFEKLLGDGDWPKPDRTRRLPKALGIDEAGVTSQREHIAAGIQRATARVVARMAGDAKRLCLAGGLGLNALLVSELERDREVFVQPAAGNAGTAVGAVLWAWHNVYRRSERVSMGDLCLGPEYAAEAIKKVLENCKLRFRYFVTTDEVIEEAVRLLTDNQIVAWMHGRMEFGPRALGNRSILASPLNPYSTENLNVFIKHREPFRKFAASVTAEAASEYFEAGPNSRYLATVGRVKPAHRKTFESAVLGDDLVRVHTVRREDNPLYYRLLEAAGRRTGLPVLYNTSFNLFGDPLVCSPRDAARSFYSSGIDAMFVGSFYLQK
jgi:carbamoyltransferase